MYYIAVINLPQRFQIVDGDSPIIAGVKLMPMMASSAVGTLTAGSINTRRNFTGYTVVLASTFLVIGYGLMITLGDAHPTPTRQFGFQVLIGLGCGWSFTATTLIAQYNVVPKWIRRCIDPSLASKVANKFLSCCTGRDDSDEDSRG